MTAYCAPPSVDAGGTSARSAQTAGLAWMRARRRTPLTLLHRTNTRRRAELASHDCLRGDCERGGRLRLGTSRHRSAPHSVRVGDNLDGHSRRSSRAPATLTAVELADKPPPGRPAAPQTLNHPQGEGREKDVARKTPLSAPPPKASPTSTKPSDVHASLEMARPGIEPGTPRFSEGLRTRG